MFRDRGAVWLLTSFMSIASATPKAMDSSIGPELSSTIIPAMAIQKVSPPDTIQHKRCRDAPRTKPLRDTDTHQARNFKTRRSETADCESMAYIRAVPSGHKGLTKATDVKGPLGRSQSNQNIGNGSKKSVVNFDRITQSLQYAHSYGSAVLKRNEIKSQNNTVNIDPQISAKSSITDKWDRIAYEVFGYANYEDYSQKN
jgi:hypothetical protein